MPNFNKNFGILAERVGIGAFRCLVVVVVHVKRDAPDSFFIKERSISSRVPVSVSIYQKPFTQSIRRQPVGVNVHDGLLVHGWVTVDTPCVLYTTESLRE